MQERKNKTGPTIYEFTYKALWVVVISVLLFGIGFAGYTKRYEGKTYPNVSIGGVPSGNKTRKEIQQYWLDKNTSFSQLTLELHAEGNIATVSAADLQAGYDATLSATQAYLVGRSKYPLGNIHNVFLKKNVDLTPYFRWNTEKIDEHLTKFANLIDVAPVDALFQFENGKVIEFKASKDGKRLNVEESRRRIAEALNKASKTDQTHFKADLLVEAVHSSIRTDQVNTLGIKDRIGHGNSVFVGSIPGRIHNVALGASRLNGILIPPGETFSFNDTIGDISAATGYQSAYIIKEGRTVLGDGGGVCQVSSTLFRAALNAGLPIVERHAHAYRVHYYEDGGFKPGLDATVFGPTYDLKFTNDTPGHILIQTKIDLKKLTLEFEFYGTGDGRKAEITNQKVWDITPPPPVLYQDDPTLPKGTEKQVDFEAWGAKASFEYKVIRGDEILQSKTFTSNYRPWQAVYLKGTL